MHTAPQQRPGVLVVQNASGSGPGRFGDWLAEDGLAPQTVHAWDGAALPSRLDHRALLVLGGGLLPDDDARAPWLATVRALTAEALDRGVPFFGICLGGQLLAQVAGGSVAAEHGRPEYGSTPLTLRPACADDALFHGLPTAVTAIERHVDAITALPPEAVWLAESTDCPYQAFRCADRAWGVQFHPEATADRIRHWDPQALRARGCDPQQLHRRALRDEPAATPVWREVARRFAGLVRGTGGN